MFIVTLEEWFGQYSDYECHTEGRWLLYNQKAVDEFLIRLKDKYGVREHAHQNGLYVFMPSNRDWGINVMVEEVTPTEHHLIPDVELPDIVNPY